MAPSSAANDVEGFRYETLPLPDRVPQVDRPESGRGQAGQLLWPVAVRSMQRAEIPAVVHSLRGVVVRLPGVVQGTRMFGRWIPLGRNKN